MIDSTPNVTPQSSLNSVDNNFLPSVSEIDNSAELPKLVSEPDLVPAQQVSEPIVKDTPEGNKQIVPRKEGKLQELLQSCQNSLSEKEIYSNFTKYLLAGGKVDDFSADQLQQNPQLQTAIESFRQSRETVALVEHAEELFLDDDLISEKIEKNNNDASSEKLTLKTKTGKQWAIDNFALVTLFMVADLAFFRGRTMSLIAEELAEKLTRQGVEKAFNHFGISNFDSSEQTAFLKGLLESLDPKKIDNFFLEANENTIYDFLKLMEKNDREKMLAGQMFGGISGKKTSLSENTLKILQTKLSNLSEARQFALGIEAHKTA